MPPKPNSRNWNDVQTAIATVAIVTTLGLWNLFASPSKNEGTKTSQPALPPTEPPIASAPTVMPKVKIIFTQTAPQTLVQQVQNNLIKKKKNKNNNGGSVSITQTKSS
jgi:hypothetical protein